MLPQAVARSPATATEKELLAQRYARGVIDDDEYFQRLGALDSTGAPDDSIDRARSDDVERVTRIELA